MNSVKRIAKNSGASLLAQVSNPISSFILVFFIARLLGVSGLGVLSSALSIFYIFQALSSLGFNYLITREVAQDKAKAGKYLINASLLGAIVSILMVFIMCLVVNFITDVTDIKSAVYIMSIALVPSTLAVVFQSICRAFEKIEYITISQIVGNVFKGIFGLIVLFKGFGIISLVTVIMGSNFLICLMSYFFAVRCTAKKRFKVDIDFCKWIIKATPVFAFIFIVHTIRWNIDILLLTNMMGETEVGYYNAAIRLINICKLGLSCYIFAIQPVIFKLFRSSIEKFKLLCEDSIRYLLIITIPVALGITLLSDKLILLVFNQDFLPATNVLAITIWIQVLAGANLIFASALVACNKQKVNLKGIVISMIVNICLNLILIPKFDIIGAAVASLSSSFVLLSYQYLFISKHLFRISFIRISIKPTISAAIMGTVILLIKDANLPFVIALSMGIYVACLLVLKTFSPEDKKLWSKIWRKDGNLNISTSSL